MGLDPFLSPCLLGGSIKAGAFTLKSLSFSQIWGKKGPKFSPAAPYSSPAAGSWGPAPSPPKSLYQHMLDHPAHGWSQVRSRAAAACQAPHTRKLRALGEEL